MGLYDTFRSKDGSVELQVKAGPCLMDSYKTGDKVHRSYMASCVIHAYGGSVLIRNHVVIAVTDQELKIEDVPHLDKWGNVYTLGANLDENNPVVQAMDEEEARQRMNEYNKWGDKLKEVLGDEQFVAFAEFMDGCDDVSFSHVLAERAAKIAPDKYILPGDTEEDMNRKMEKFKND